MVSWLPVAGFGVEPPARVCPMSVGIGLLRGGVAGFFSSLLLVIGEVRLNFGLSPLEGNLEKGLLSM